MVLSSGSILVLIHTPIREALSLLKKAGIAHLFYHTAAQGLPLAAACKENTYKAFFFDIGLAQNLLGLSLHEWVLQPLEVTFKGAIAEQFVAQEYIAYSAKNAPPPLFYWQREESSSTAEIDFIFLKKNKIIPVKVKSSERRGGMKSMKLFLDSHPHSPYGLKISPLIKGTLPTTPTLQKISFYQIESWLSVETEGL